MFANSISSMRHDAGGGTNKRLCRRILDMNPGEFGSTTNQGQQSSEDRGTESAVCQSQWSIDRPLLKRNRAEHSAGSIADGAGILFDFRVVLEVRSMLHERLQKPTTDVLADNLFDMSQAQHWQPHVKTVDGIDGTTARPTEG